MSAVLELACELIRRPSVTPVDAGCQELIADHLDSLGFVIEHMPFGQVSNLWARRGNAGPLLCLAGHTDVVPPGPVDQWMSNPFMPEVRDGLLYGRGAADMKGGLAAMLIATERFVRATPDHAVSLAFLITSDEEGVAVDGTQRVMQELNERGEQINFCIVGEPSSMKTLGDTVRVGRRGSLHGDLRIRGVQGHVAYPERADNPIHRAAPALARLALEHWDDGNEYFPATTLQISNISAGTGADNVIPATLDALFNFRYSTAITKDELRRRVHALLDEFELQYELTWRVGGEPFLTAGGKLIEHVCAVLNEQTGHATELSTGGGTSDGRFIAPYGTEVVELGPVNASIHKIDEHVSVTELDRLTGIYEAILQRFDPELTGVLLVCAMSNNAHIYVDADACPVKPETVKVAVRHGLPVTFVANAWMQLPRGPRIHMQVVSGAFDAADDWIVEKVQRDDIVITGDIPLAARCLQAGARVLGPAGKPFTDDNIGNALATRELMADLRAYGVGGGPPPFEQRDRSRFLQALELAAREVTGNS